MHVSSPFLGRISVILFFLALAALPAQAECTKPPSIGLSILPPDSTSTQYRAVISHTNVSLIEYYWRGVRQEFSPSVSPAILFVNDTTCLLEPLPFRVVGHAFGCAPVEQTATIAPLDDKPEVMSISLAAPGDDSYIYKATVHHRNADRMEYIYRGVFVGNVPIGPDPFVLNLDANCLTEAEQLTVRVWRTLCAKDERIESVPPLSSTPAISTEGFDGEGKVKIRWSFPHT